jgi:TolB-like protein/DNA-binding SARP family transcriptional activator
MLQLRLLGPFELRRDDGTAVPLPGRQSMAVLACLGLADYFTVPRERLAELIWAGRGIEQANGSLRQELARLRRTIGGQVLPAAGTTSQPVRLDITDIDIDVVRFRDAAAAPGGGAEAIALYRGPLLQDFPLRPRDPFGEWIAEHRQKLRDVARALMLRMLRGGEGSPALAQRLLVLDPLCEEAYRFLIRHYAGGGDLASAQRWFNACAASFGEAGLETSLEIRALIEDAKAELVRSSANTFQVAHPADAIETTQWLRASLDRRSSLQRPSAQILAEISDRPSIVVLPFHDLTGVPEFRNRLLADIVTEETTAALTRVNGLFVSARQSAMAYRNAAIDVRLIAAELGVRYLIEGSVVSSGRSTRCNVRLIDGRTGLHIWADQVECAADDELALRDRILHETIGRLMPRLLVAEVVRAGARRKAPRDAYTALMRARAELLREQSFEEALRRAMMSVREALALDPENAEAHAMAAYFLAFQTWSRFSPQPLRDRWRARRFMRGALRRDPENATVLAMCSEVALLCADDIDQALALSEAAVRHDPHDAQALALLGHIRRMAGSDPRGSLALIEHAQRLSPRDPRTFLWLLYGVWCHWKLGEYTAMEAMARRSLGLYSNIPWTWLGLAGALALQKKHAEASEALASIRALMPSYTPSRFHLGAQYVYGRRFRGHVKDDYRKLRDALNASLNSKPQPVRQQTEGELGT